ncbi:MAG: hypothetical protein AAFN74_16925 [Myxococcota bacterium]
MKDAATMPDEAACQGLRPPFFVLVVKTDDIDYTASFHERNTQGLCVLARMTGPEAEPGPVVAHPLDSEPALLRVDWPVALALETSCGTDGEVPSCRTALVVRILGQDYELESADVERPLGEAFRFVRTSIREGVPLTEQDRALLDSGSWPLL